MFAKIMEGIFLRNVSKWLKERDENAAYFHKHFATKRRAFIFDKSFSFQWCSPNYIHDFLMQTFVCHGLKKKYSVLWTNIMTSFCGNLD